ncbi:uncharacterized protein LOC120351783 [Nilaparvata lugens]|uniref:uncharacterized protein LOC120351783 n=1 Tax=Nilaparvata lugens TaxID=108931 RepID=UPI00193CDF25|nr:uncharacterized protein LOC120351783 [Nilaparvata lugens]
MSKKNDEKSSQNVGMILNIGRQRPLYHEQFEYLQSFENANFISADWAKLAASAVQPSPTTCKVSRLLIPVQCDKLVKLIECQDEFKKFDKNVEYGMERLDVDGEEEEEERKEEEEEEEKKKKVKRKSAISSVVKGVVAKLVDTVVADEEDLNLDKVVSQRRVSRELKRLNASLIEVEEEAARPPDDADNNLAKVKKEYHQTVFMKKDKIIFMKGNNKRARRCPMKLDDHVFEVGEENEVEEEATKRSRIDPAKEYNTDLIRQVEASVEHELSNPPIRDCFVKLVKAKLDQLQKPSPIVNDSDETSENPTPIVNNSEENYVEEICSLPKFNLKVPEHVTRPPLYKIGSTNDVGPSKCKKRKIEESEMVNSSPLSSIVRTKDLNGLKLGSLSSNSDLPAVQQKRVLLNNNSSHNSKDVPDAQKRIKTLKPVLTPRKIDQQPTIPSPDKDGSPKRIKTLQPALPSHDKDGSPKRIKTLQPALPSPGQDGSPKLIKTLQPALPSPGQDGSPKRIKTLQPALPSPGKDGSPQCIKTLQPALPSPGKDRSPKRFKTLQPALPTPGQDGSSKRIKTLQPALPSPGQDGSPKRIKTEVRFKEIAGDFEKTTYNNKDVVSRSQYEFGIHILKRDSVSEMVYMPYAYDMKHNEDGYFGMYFHRGSPDTVMVGPFQMNEDPQIFVHRGRNPVCVTLANKWCEDKDFLDTFWNCHNKVLLKHIVKYAYANRAYVYKTRKPQPKFINIIRRSLYVSNHQTLNSTRNLCAEPAPPVELESTESKKVDVDPVEDGEKNRVRSLRPAPPVELESTESKKVDVDPLEDGENTQVRSLKKAEAENPETGDQLVNDNGCEPEAGTPNKDGECTTDKVKEAKRESKSVTPISEQPTLSDHLIEKERQFFEFARKLNTLALNSVKLSIKNNEMNQSVKDNVELTSVAKKKKKTVTFADELLLVMPESPKKVDADTELVEQNSLPVRKDVKIVGFDKGNPEVIEKNNAAEIDSHLIKQNALSVRKDLEIKKHFNKIEIKNKNAVEAGGRDFDIIIRNVDEKGKVVSEVEKKSNAAEIDSCLVRKNAISVRKDLEIVRKGDKVDHTSNNRKDTNPIEPKVIETIDLCESEPTVPNVTLTETRAEPTERDMSKKSAKVAKSIEKQPKVERKIYPTIGFRKIEPKPTTLFFDKGTSKMFFRVDNAKSILNLEKLQTPNSAKQTEAVEVHNPVITTRTQAKKPATNQNQQQIKTSNKSTQAKKPATNQNQQQINQQQVIEPTKSTNQVQVLPTTSSSAASKFTIKMQAKNPATKVIEPPKSTNQVQVLPTTSSSAASKFTIQFQTRNPATNKIPSTKVIETTNSTNKDQCLPKVIQIPRFLIPNAANGSPIQIQALPKLIQIPRILNPNAATKQSFGPQYLLLSPLTDGQEKKFSIQHLIPYDDDDTPQSAGEKSVGLTKQNPSDKPMAHVVQIDGKKFLQSLPSTSSLSATEIQSMLSKGNNKVLITMGKTDKLVSLQNNQSVVRLTKTLGLQATQSPTNSIQPPSSSLNLPSDASKLTTTVTLKEAPSISISNLAEKSVSQPTSVQKVTPPEKVSPFKVVVVSNHAEKTSESTKSHEKSPKVSKGNQTNLPKVTIKTIPKKVSVTDYAENTSDIQSLEKQPELPKGNQTKVPKVSTETPKEVSPLEASIMNHHENTSHPTNTPKEVSTPEASIMNHHENTPDPTNTPKEVSPLETSIMNHHENTSHPTNTPKEVSTLEASIMNHHENTPDPTNTPKEVSPLETSIMNHHENTSDPTNTPKEVPPLEASITTHPENTTEPIKSPEETTQQEKTEFEVIEALKNNPEYMLSFGLSFSNDW